MYEPMTNDSGIHRPGEGFGRPGSPPNLRDAPPPGVPSMLPPEVSVGLPRLMTFEYARRIQEEFQMVERRLADLAKEKAELQTHYLRYYELSYQLNAELSRLADINYRYQAIINQLLPMVSPAVQTGVQNDMQSIKNIAEQPINGRPPYPTGPAHFPDQVRPVAGPPPVASNDLPTSPEIADGKRKGRPLKRKDDISEKRDKRFKTDHEEETHSIAAPAFPR
ncbi:hypothetical protein HK097_011594, partial [Rhizophlyctis rosea]